MADGFDAASWFRPFIWSPGEPALKIDKMFRTLVFGACAETSQFIDEDTRKALQAYADGVNQLFPQQRQIPVESTLNIEPDVEQVEFNRVFAVVCGNKLIHTISICLQCFRVSSSMNWESFCACLQRPSVRNILSIFKAGSPRTSDKRPEQLAASNPSAITDLVQCVPDRKESICSDWALIWGSHIHRDKLYLVRKSCTRMVPEIFENDLLLNNNQLLHGEHNNHDRCNNSDNSFLRDSHEYPCVYNKIPSDWLYQSDGINVSKLKKQCNSTKSGRTASD